MKIEKLAKGINQDCETFKHFWAYGTIKETIQLWHDGNIDLLCQDAKIMVEQVRETLT